MAILQNRLSTSPVPGIYLDPDGRDRPTFNTDWEMGPKSITDTSEGLAFQVWKLLFFDTNFIVTPETVGSPVLVLPGQDSVQCALAFDQNARPAIAWIDSLGIGHLYWYDTVDAKFVTSDLGPMGGIALYLDDKRAMQTSVSDILLVYTVYETDHFVLYHRRQRDRYTTPYPLKNPAKQYILKAGMHDALRGQFLLVNAQYTELPPVTPPGPSIPQANLDFELGDIYWAKTGNFVINSSDPYSGSWSAILTPGPSTLENTVKTSLTPDSPVYMSCLVKGTEATTIKIGFRFYNSANALLTTDTVIKNITTGWTQISHSLLAPTYGAYVSLFVESDSTTGTVSFDNFNFLTTLDTGSFFMVDFNTTVNLYVEFDTPVALEVEL